MKLVSINLNRLVLAPQKSFFLGDDTECCINMHVPTNKTEELNNVVVKFEYVGSMYMEFLKDRSSRHVIQILFIPIHF